MPSYDLLTYQDFNDTNRERDVAQVGDDARELFGAEEGQYVVAVGPPLHEGKDATVVIAHAHAGDDQREDWIPLERLVAQEQPTASY